MRLYFIGMGQIGLAALTTLLAGEQTLAGVETSAGCWSTPRLKALCGSRGLAFTACDRPAWPELVQRIRAGAADLIVVAGYPWRLPPEVLAAARQGAINLHDSLLPQYRGPNTSRWVLLRGERWTGATIHVMTPAFDNGPILAQEVVEIAEEDDAASLFGRVSQVAARLLPGVLAEIAVGRAVPRPQEEERATYFGYPGEAERRIDWSRDAASIRNQVRAFAPAPGALTTWQGEPLKLLRATLAEHQGGAGPGTVARVTADGVLVATGRAALLALELEDAGGRRWSATARVRDLPLAAGQRLGTPS